MKPKIFVALSTFATEDRAPLERLEASGVDFTLHTTGKRITKQELVEFARGATVILAGVESYDAEVLATLPDLLCISRCGVGVDAIDLGAAGARGVVVLNTPGIPTQAVAELALTMMLALLRNLLPHTDLMRQGRWERLSAQLFSGRTVGLLGLGQIGKRVARLCRAFDAQVIAFDPFVSGSADATLVSREELLRESDILSLHASRNPDQAVLIGAAELAAMKSGALLVNLARGDMVDETALVEALRSGRLAGAGLDVFPKEPYHGPLCDMSQVVLTPHCATNTLQTRVAMESACVENALRFVRNEAVLNLAVGE